MVDEKPNHEPHQHVEGEQPSELLHVGADVDVRALMQEIKAEVERKRAAGAYPRELLAQLSSVYGQDELGRALTDVRHALMASPYQPITSHRKGIGPAIVFGKRAIRRLLRSHTQGISQQTQIIGGSLSRALEAVTDQMQTIERDVASLREDVGQLQSRQAAASQSPPVPSSRPAQETHSGRDIDMAIDYVAFEDRFRGSRDDLTERQSQYLQHFSDARGRVLDVGCGRGEFLAALRGEGIDAYGVDFNPDMVTVCHRDGLDVVEGDVLTHLRSVNADALGGIFCAQVLEHLDKRSVVEFFSLAARTIRPGGILVAETLNPQSLCTLTGPLYVDLDHTQPLHPLTLQFLAEAAGFVEVGIQYTSPMPPQFHVQQLPAAGVDASLAPLVETINENFRKLDDVLYGPIDFAIIAKVA